MKTVIITGAAGNLGQTVVKKFAANGYQVIATVSPGKSLGYDVPGKIDVYPVDLTNEAQVVGLIGQWTARYKTIDSALLLAGGYASGNIQQTSVEAIRNMIAINFETAYTLVRAVFNKMATQSDGGRIVLIGARTALKPTDGKNSLAYALSKSLNFQLADILNAEGIKRNIVTSVIVPSTIDTPANRKAMPEADVTKWVPTEDIADAMLYLCSDKAKALSNPVLKIYGNS
jgi:NAD(P)-dependent dehydrogenase (short-subunit alcohol dehydrogenase family)